MCRKMNQIHTALRSRNKSGCVAPAGHLGSKPIEHAMWVGGAVTPYRLIQSYTFRQSKIIRNHVNDYEDFKIKVTNSKKFLTFNCYIVQHKGPFPMRWSVAKSLLN